MGQRIAHLKQCLGLAGLVVLVSCGGRGGSGGSDPTITGIGPGQVVAAPMSSFLTVTGTNLSRVESVTVNGPGGATTATRSAAQIRQVTQTSFLLIVPIPQGGSHTFQVRTEDGKASNSFSLSVSAPIWADEGERLLPTAFTPNNGQIADDSVVQLQDGRWRMYVQVFGTGTRTAVSTDGLTWTAEQTPVIPTGSRTPDGIFLAHTHPRAVVLADGRVRVFIVGTPEGIHSAICEKEGVPCALEAGQRVGAGGLILSGPGIVRLADGRWRMYFGAKSSGAAEETERILSAISTDMLAWTIEPGVRIGPGSTLSGNANHPSVVANDNGSFTVVYKRVGRDTEIDRDGFWSATSTDGLTFGSETKLFGNQVGSTSSGVGDPDAVRLADGRIRIYASWTSSTGGPVDTFRIRSYIGRLPTPDAWLKSESSVRELTDAALDAISPVHLPAAHSVRDRVARAEQAYRAGSSLPIPIARVVQSFNAVAESVSAPEWARTNTEQLQSARLEVAELFPGLAGHPRSPDLAPLEAVMAGLSLTRRKLEDPDYQVHPDEWVRARRDRTASPWPRPLAEQWRARTQELLLIRPMLVIVESGLADERQEPSWRAHMFLSMLGLPR